MAQLDERVGLMLQAAGESAENSKHAARDAKAARVAAEQMAARVYAPVNEVIAAKYSSAPPSDELLGDEFGDVTKVQSRPVLAKRLKDAQKEAVRLAIEADRLAREAQAEKERIERAAKLETERLAKEKERTRLVNAAITAGIALATAIAAALTTYAAGH